MTETCLSQIIGTAVIDDGFRSMLLANPKSALAQFDLEASDLSDISSIRANSIEQFAEKLIAWMNTRELKWA
jgi:hypothetical protein